MTYVEIISGPLIGAIIGYCTNYIAVKMLFRPKKEIKIWGYRLPFTPGIIPKGKTRLAKALGKAVKENLFTDEDLRKVFLSDEVLEKISEEVLKLFRNPDISIREKIIQVCDQYCYEQIKDNVTKYVFSALKKMLRNAHLAALIKEKGSAAIKEQMAGSVLGMFVSEDLICKMINPLANKAEKYVNEDCDDFIFSFISTELEKVEEKSIRDTFTDEAENKIKFLLEKIYKKFISEKMTVIFEKFDIDSIVEEKVNAMTVDEVEDLVMSVMKKELYSIVNLGAFIGFLIGILNIFL